MSDRQTVTRLHIAQLAQCRGAEPTPRHAHLVGVCGAGMRGLAHLLHGWGWSLSASDRQPLPAALFDRLSEGLIFYQGHLAEQLPATTDVLIHSPAISVDNPERQTARARGIPEWTYTQALAALAAGRQTVCIAGTHGKSTTTAMTATILTDAGLNPSAIFGADRCDNDLNAWGGRGDLFVIESCEFQRSFLEFDPQFAAILGVEPDHFDCFADRESLVATFGEFASRVHADGLLLIRAEDSGAREAAAQCPAPIATFGWTTDADWWATDLRRTANGHRFRVFRRGCYITELSIPVFGKHNVLNALAAAALSFEMGVRPSAIRQSLAEFPGVRRRFETVGSWRGATLIDDYAHHPTAVELTLQTARELFGSRRVWVAFQPHQVSRTRALMQDFSRSFRLADRVLVAPVFAARELVTDEPTLVSQELAAQMTALKIEAEFSPSLDQLVTVLEDGLRPGDVLLTMGAGDIDQVYHAFTRRVQRHPSARRQSRAVHVVEGGGTRAVLPHSA